MQLATKDLMSVEVDCKFKEIIPRLDEHVNLAAEEELAIMVEDLLYKSLQKYFQFIWTILASIFTLSKVQAVIPPSEHSK